jgi:hypothetical protein
MDRRLATSRPAGSARNTRRQTSRAVYLIDYVTWYARLAGSTRPIFVTIPGRDGRRVDRRRCRGRVTEIGRFPTIGRVV